MMTEYRVLYRSVLMKSRKANSKRCMPSMNAISNGLPPVGASGSGRAEVLVTRGPDQVASVSPRSPP